MRTFTFTVLVALVIYLLDAGAVTAHDNDGNTTGHDDVPVNGSAANWATWTEQHMTVHTGADARMDGHELRGNERTHGRSP